MLISYIRSSSYNQWDMCQQSYFITYVLGYQTDSGKSAEIGTVVHKALEVLACLKKYQQDNPTSKQLEITDDAVGVVKINQSQLLTDSFVEELLNLSFNSYTSQSKHEWGKSDRKNCLNLTLKGLQYNDGQFDPRLRNVVDPEPHFDIPIEEDWAKFETVMSDGTVLTNQFAIKGTIDLVTEVNPEVIEVIDWKTGARKNWATGEEKTYEKLQNDPQLLLYNYAISKKYPQYKQSIMTIFFIKDGGPFSMCFDESDNDRFLVMLKRRFEEIKRTEKPRLVSSDRSNWKCKKLCHYYKNNWPGTNKSMCQHVDEHMKKHGMQETLVQLTKPDFKINFYEAPG